MSDNIRLPQFLNDVDAVTKKMSKENLSAFIHEIARTWPESRRQDYKQPLLSFHDNLSNSVNTDTFDVVQTQLVTEINTIKKKLAEINRGEKLLDSEYNEEWDDWYNSDAEEILFTDPMNLLKDIRFAIMLIHECIDMEVYDEGMELAEILSVLEIFADGDYNDYDGSPLDIKELYYRNLISSDFDQLVTECLYLTYVGNNLQDRAEEMFCMLENFGSCKVRLEDVLQAGNRELPEFDEFLTLWLDYLGNQKGTRAKKFLEEAQSMLPNDGSMLENARKFVNTHPSLYLQLLEMNQTSGNDRQMLEIGFEALDSIPSCYLIRGKIALLTATYAYNVYDYDRAEKCWLEAFRSDSTVVNYMRLRFESKHWKQYQPEVRTIMDALYKKEKNYQTSYTSDEFSENSISRNEYCTMLFFEQEFEQMKTIGMNTNSYLGWSSTFMKEGISFMLLLLYSGDTLPSGLISMQKRVLSSCQFSLKDYYCGTDHSTEINNYEVFGNLMKKWKEDVSLSESEKETWITNIRKWISQRTRTIMENNKRNYYEECAGFIAALGEVIESFGNKGAKANLMEEYRFEYSRRRAFHEELHRYGMKK